MDKLNLTQLSGYRSRIRDLVNLIETRAFGFCSLKALVRGSPGTVMRKCGEPTCKCQNGGDDRHGPYKSLQIFKKGRHRQISISKKKEHLWDKAQAWQREKQHLIELKAACSTLEKLIGEILERRLEDPEDCP